MRGGEDNRILSLMAKVDNTWWGKSDSNLDDCMWEILRVVHLGFAHTIARYSESTDSLICKINAGVSTYNLCPQQMDEIKY